MSNATIYDAVAAQIDLLDYVPREPATTRQSSPTEADRLAPATVVASTDPRPPEPFDPNAPPPWGRPLLLVIDATNLGHRLFHAPSDLPVAERFGFALTRWRKTIEPDFAVAIFDGPGDGWREAIYPAYKGSRNKDPTKRPSATDWRDIHAACRGARLRVVRVDGVEADDLIGSYTVAAVAAGFDVAILSGDKDMQQLVADSPTRVRQHDPGGRDVLGPAEVRAKYGVEPGQLADYLAIVGDKSDNYPGIVGVGRTRAAGLLAKFGTLEAVLANANLIPGNRARIVREGRAGQVVPAALGSGHRPRAPGADPRLRLACRAQAG
jgi:5'-3' exonuclease